MKNLVKISKAATIIVFIALIRITLEPFRLQYYSDTRLNFDQLMPFLLGAAILAAGLLATTILFYYQKHKLIIALAVLQIIILFIIKFTYLR